MRPSPTRQTAVPKGRCRGSLLDVCSGTWDRTPSEVHKQSVSPPPPFPPVHHTRTTVYLVCYTKLFGSTPRYRLPIRYYLEYSRAWRVFQYLGTRYVQSTHGTYVMACQPKGHGYDSSWYELFLVKHSLAGWKPACRSVLMRGQCSKWRCIGSHLHAFIPSFLHFISASYVSLGEDSAGG